MEKITNIKEAQNWFLSHSSGNVIAVNSKAEEKVCNYYGEAEEFLSNSN